MNKLELHLVEIDFKKDFLRSLIYFLNPGVFFQEKPYRISVCMNHPFIRSERIFIHEFGHYKYQVKLDKKYSNTLFQRIIKHIVSMSHESEAIDFEDKFFEKWEDPIKYRLKTLFFYILAVVWYIPFVLLMWVLDYKKVYLNGEDSYT